MKFKLGLAIGATVGYMFGSGRAQKMLRNMRAEARDRARMERFGEYARDDSGQTEIDFGDPAFTANIGLTSITLSDTPSDSAPSANSANEATNTPVTNI